MKKILEEFTLDKMKKFMTGIGLSLVTTTVFGGANAQYQQCQQILGQGYYNQLVQSGRSFSKETPRMKALICNAISGQNHTGMSQDQIQDTIDSTGYQSIESFKKSVCSGIKNQYSPADAAHILIQQIDHSVIDAWSHCIKDSNDGMAMWGQELGQELVELTLDWKGGYGRLKHIKFNYYNLKPIKKVNKSSLYLGSRKYMFKKLNPDKPAFVVVSGETRYREHSWSYSCPGKADRIK